MKRIVALSALIALAVASQATLISAWDFKNNNLAVSYNPNGLAVGATGAGSLNFLGGGSATFATTTVGTFTKNVVHLNAANYLQVAHGVPKNDTGGYANTFSVLIDMKLSGAAGVGLLNSGYDDYNGQEAALRSTGKAVVGSNVGDTGGTEGASTVVETQWNRYVVVRRASGTGYVMDVYANGGLLVSGDSGSLDGGPSLYTPLDTANPYSVIGGHNSFLSSAQADVSAIGFFDNALTQSQVSALGAVGTAVPEPSPYLALCLGVPVLLMRRRAN